MAAQTLVIQQGNHADGEAICLLALEKMSRVASCVACAIECFMNGRK